MSAHGRSKALMPERQRREGDSSSAHGRSKALRGRPFPWFAVVYLGSVLAAGSAVLLWPDAAASAFDALRLA